MAHPTMGDRGDLSLAGLRQICLRLPGAAEKVSHGRPCFFTKKVLAIYGAVTKGDHHSGRYDTSVLILPNRTRQPHFWPPPASSFRLTAPPSLVARLPQTA